MKFLVLFALSTTLLAQCPAGQPTKGKWSVTSNITVRKAASRNNGQYYINGGIYVGGYVAMDDSTYEDYELSDTHEICGAIHSTYTDTGLARWHAELRQKEISVWATEESAKKAVEDACAPVSTVYPAWATPQFTAPFIPSCGGSVCLTTGPTYNQ